jgi:hypothetical protein
MLRGEGFFVLEKGIKIFEHKYNPALPWLKPGKA